jgi:hypothetical protein
MSRSRREPSGLRAAPPPPDGADALTAALHYLAFYEEDFARVRTTMKRRAKRVVVGTAAGNGAVGVIGAATAFSDLAWLGLVSAAVAAVIGVLAAWDGLFRHRDLWVQRSVILGRLNLARRNAEFAKAAGENPDDVAATAMSDLNAILADDLATWGDLKRSRTGEVPNAIA